MRIVLVAKAGIGKIVNIVLNLYVRSKIQNYNFSILCSNCIGGVIYNRLGFEFLTPTINLFILQKDFVKLVKNPKWYIKQELEFFEQKWGFPNAMLGDICIYFNHSSDEEHARNDWNRRKRRIVWENLYIILYENDGISREDILSLSSVKCKRLIVLTDKKQNLDIPYVKYIKPCEKDRANKQVFLDKDFWGIRTFEKRWDYVSWINGK